MDPHKGARSDTTDRWRDSYKRVRKDLLKDNEATNRDRLRTLGFELVHKDARFLDVGAGDGNLFATLDALGYSGYHGLEYQPELAAVHPGRNRLAVASGTHIPYATGSMDAVIVMDVLHHLTPQQLPACLGEMRRVMRSGGLLFVCEPARTLVRRALTVLLFSPLGNVAQFSRDKRAMVEEERATLDPWLEAEPQAQRRICAAGFREELFRRFWLHNYGRFRAV
jgi:2-polyprenyl-3-methyl-5-hydroxy-6-metoxy-1,4-benzoquinol methylase